MHIEQKVNIHNRFDVEVRNAKTGELELEAVGFNIVLDQMWTRLCGGSSYFINIHFGTGSGTLSPSRTSLFSHLSTKAAADEEQVKAIPVSRWKRKIVLNPEEFVDSTITEVGIAFGSTPSNLVTHAMLKDSEGNPISITKRNDQVITIYATVFVTINNEVGITMLGMPASNQLVNYLVGGSGAPTGSFGLLPGEGYGTRLGSTATVTWTADVPNKKRKTNIPRFGINDANGHVIGLEFTNLFTLHFPMAGVFQGLHYTGVVIGSGDGVKNKFLLPSKNIDMSSIVIKVDGVTENSVAKKEVSTVNFSYSTPQTITGVDSLAASPNGEYFIIASDYLATIFKKIEGKWVKKTQIATPASLPYGCAISNDGETVVIAYGGSPYVFVADWDGSGWVPSTPLSDLPSANCFGASITPDGNMFALASNNAACVYKRSNKTSPWVRLTNPPSAPQYPRRVSLSGDGSILACSTNSSNVMAVWDYVDNTWNKRTNPPATNGNIQDIKLSLDGVLLVVGHESYPYFSSWDWTDSLWIPRSTPASTLDSRCSGVCLTPDKLQLYISSTGGGAKKVNGYDWEDSNWVEKPATSVTLDNLDFIAVNDNGDTLVILAAGGAILMLDTKKRDAEIQLSSSPSEGKVITADYKVNGVHKTNQYVVDTSFAIAFGEGA